MARIRTIKPEFFTSEDIVSLTPLARLFYVSLWCEADREGRLKWSPKTLKLRYFPADDCDIQELADELLAAGLIHLYSVDGMSLAYIPSFASHQSINNRESESVLPEPPFVTPGTRPSRVKVDAEGKGKEGKGREGKETPSGEAGASVPVAYVISKSGNPTIVTEAHIATWLIRFPGVDVRNEVRRICDWTRGHPRPEKDDLIAWLESKLAQRYEEHLAKRLADENGGRPKNPDDDIDPDERAALMAAKAAAEARHVRR